MFDFVKRVFRVYFSRPEAGLVVFVLIGIALAFRYLGAYLVPFFVALFIAFLLNELVVFMKRYNVPHVFAVFASFVLFLAAVSVICFLFLPLAIRRAIEFIQAFPAILERVSTWLYLLPERLPEIFAEDDIDRLIVNFRQAFIDYAQSFLSSSPSSIVEISTFAVYVVLVIILVLFLLMDFSKLTDSVFKLLPKDDTIILSLAGKMKQEMLRYINGKILEALIVFSAAWITFAVLGLNFAFLLAIVVGLSVLIPYVGALIVTIPVAAVAYAQFGPSNAFAYVLLAYLILQILDGYVLVPLLFSEIINLHPVSVILAIIIFGSIWGIWGIAFAIPLATFIRALIEYWPRANDSPEALRK